MTDHTDIVERLNAITPDQGWAVVNKKTEGVVIWFSKWKTFNAHKEALAFLGEHRHYAETHEVREYMNPCLEHEAAAEITRLRAEAEALRKALAAIVDRDFTFFDGCVDRNTITYGEIQQARAALSAQPVAGAAPEPSAQAVAHPSHQTVREWMPVSEALRLSDLWTAGDLDNCGQWRAAIKVLADEVRALAASPQPAEPSAQGEPVRQADERGDMAMREWHRECDDADTILRALGLDPVNCRTDGGSLKTGMILDALQARDRILQRAASPQPAEPSAGPC